MGLFTPDKTELLNRINTYSKEAMGLTPDAPGTKIHYFNNAQAALLDSMNKIFDANVAVGYLYGASGKFLDYLSHQFGMKRIDGRKAYASASQSRVKFFTNLSSFSQISSTPITIYAGTYIWAIKDGAKVEFYTTETVNLNMSANTQYVSVMSREFNSFSNIEANTLVNHNLTYKNLFVTNELPLDNGQDIESDENFRYRIANAHSSKKGANLNAILQATLEVPGVSDADIFEGEDGIGTITVYVKPEVISSSTNAYNDLTTRVQYAVNEYRPIGISINVKMPDFITVDGSVKLTVKSGTTVGSLANAIQASISNYIDNLDIGESIDPNAIASVIKNTDINILAVGTPLSAFKSLSMNVPIYHGSSTKKKTSLTGAFEPKSYQKFVKGVWTIE